MKTSFKKIDLTSSSSIISVADKNKFYSVSGTFAAARTITITGALSEMISLIFIVKVDKNSQTFTLLGEVVTSYLVNNQIYVIEAIYVDGAWLLNINASFNGTSIINRATLIPDSLITDAKLSNMAANTVKVNATSGSAVPTNLSLATNQIILRAGSNITAHTLNANSLLGRLAGNIVNVSFLDEDDMVSGSASAVASQQSISNFKCHGGSSSIGLAFLQVLSENLRSMSLLTLNSCSDNTLVEGDLAANQGIENYIIWSESAYRNYYYSNIYVKSLNSSGYGVILSNVNLTFGDTTSDGPFSFGCWWYVYDNGAEEVIFSKWDDAGEKEYQFYTLDGKLYAKFYDTINDVYKISYSTVVSEGWHFVVFSCENASTDVDISVDRKQLSTTDTRIGYVGSKPSSVDVLVGARYDTAPAVTNFGQSNISVMFFTENQILNRDIQRMYDFSKEFFFKY